MEENISKINKFTSLNINQDNYPELSKYKDIIKQKKDEYRYIIIYKGKFMMFRNDNDLLTYKNKNNLTVDDYKFYEVMDVLCNNFAHINVQTTTSIVSSEHYENYEKLNKESTAIDRPRTERIRHFVYFRFFALGSSDKPELTRFLFDTGAESTCLSKDYWDRFETLSLGNTTIVGSSGIGNGRRLSLMISVEPQEADSNLDVNEQYMNVKCLVGKELDDNVIGLDFINYFETTIRIRYLEITTAPEYRNIDHVKTADYLTAINLHLEQQAMAPFEFQD